MTRRSDPGLNRPKMGIRRTIKILHCTAVIQVIREDNVLHWTFRFLARNYSKRAIENEVKSTRLLPPVNCSATTSPIPAECLKPWPEHAETTKMRS